jgi:Uma2 family endonuclease
MGANLGISRRPLSTDEFHRMGEASIFAPDDKVELYEGELIQMAPIGMWHAGTVNLLAELFTQRAKGQTIVSVQNPIALPPLSEPQPDIALLKPRADYYRDKLANASDVLLIVEVSDTTLLYDRDVKIRLYARHGIAEAWLIDKQAQMVSIFLDPADTTGYQRVLTPERNASVTPSLLPNITISLAELW